MGLVGQLEEIELLRDPPVDVGEERERAPEPGSEGPVDVGLVDRDDGQPAELALELLLEADEILQAHLLLRAPPPADEREHERLALSDLAERDLPARRVGKVQIGERVAGDEVVSHRFLLCS